MKTLNNLFLFVLCLGFSNWAMSQGQNCSTATPASYGTNTAVYTGTGALNSCQTGSTSASWHYFVAPTTGSIDVYSCEQGQDTRFTIHKGSCGNLTTCVADADDECAQTVGGLDFASQAMGVPVTAGDTFYIEWEDRWTTTTHDWTMDYSYCTASGFDVDVSGSDATATWNTANTTAYTFTYGPQGATDPLLFTPVTGTSGSMVTGMATGVYDFYLIDSCYFNGVSIGATPIGPITVCVPGYSSIINTAPISESFENCGGAGLSPFWTQSTMDAMNWTQLTGSTGSFGTGPTSAFDGNEYIYIETSGPAAGSNAIITTSWIDVTGLSIPAVRFNYHMWGATTGTLNVEATADSVWTTIFTESGDQGNQWNTGAVNLAGLGDTIKLRFTAISGSSYTSDIAIDYVRVEEYCLPVMTAPYLENFEGGASCMENSTMDVLEWTIDANGTPSAGTGPSMGADSSEYYAFVEASGPNPGDSAIYTTSLVDITPLVYPELKFNYHMYGTFMGTLRAEMSNDQGMTWTSIWEQTGDHGDEWHQARINLTTLNAADTVQVRFVGVRGASWSSDMAIDNISIANGMASDLVATSVVSTYPGCASPGVPVAFEVTNYGFMDITSDFTFGVIVNSTLLTETHTGTITPGQTVLLTLSNGMDLMPGANEISYGFVGADFGDEDDTNDFIDEEIMMSDTEDGDAYATSWEGTEDGWRGTGDFELGAPAGTVITGTTDGTDAWATGLAANYHDVTESYLYSPCFDFSAYASDPTVSFDINWDIETDWDGAWLEVSTDGGNSYTKVGAMGNGTNWYNKDVSANQPIGEVWNGEGVDGSNGWVSASNRVMGTAGEGSVQFRFVMWSDASTNAEGVAIDNFKIEDWCPADLGLTTTLFPSTGATISDGGAVVTATNGTAPYTYLWSNGATTAVVDTLNGNATYTVTVTDANGCTDMATVNTSVVSDDFISSMTSLDMFPNPTNATANIIVAFEQAVDVNVELVNMLGQVVVSERQNATTRGQFAFDVSDFAAGVYMVRIQANGQQVARKLVITE